MEMTFGTVICALGGLAGAIFALPFRGIHDWKYESYWLVYSVFGLVAFPALLALLACPVAFDVIKEAPQETLLRCFGFGALWGVGGLTWGLMIRYLGIGLGLAIGCGLCSATGTLIPPIVTGHASDLVKDASAVCTLASVGISLLGILLIGLAGKMKESELPEEEKKIAVADFNFKKGIIVAIFSGIASAGMNFGLQGGTELENAALAREADPSWAGIPVLLVVLAGGFVVNALWCLWQNAKNRSFGDYVDSNGPLATRYVFAALAGVIWAMQFVCQKVGEPAMGEMRYISFAVVMGSCVLFSSLLGMFLGEWHGTGQKTRGVLAAGILVLVVSIVLAAVAKTF